LKISAILALVLVSHALAPTSEAEPARAADAFVDFIGVNTHLGYGDTAYSNYEGIVKPRLLELGVRHIRDGTFNDDVLRKYLDLGAHGIRVLLITDSTHAVERAQKLHSTLFAVEGVNEPDARGGEWVSRIRAEQQRLYEAVKGNPSTKDVPVLVSSLANLRDSPAKLGDLTGRLDFGNMHPYAAGHPPSQHWGWGLSMEKAVAEGRKVSGDKPIVVTECGYHNCTEEKGHPGVTEPAEAKYLPRLLFVYFDRGMVKAYKYEFLDEKPDPGFTDMEKHFGLVRFDGTPKPAFIALKNVIHLLADPGPTKEPGSLAYELGGDTNNLHQTLLQKRDGTFWLALFHEANSYDLKARHDIDVPAVSVTLKLPWTSSLVRLFRPNVSTAPVEQISKTKQVSLQVPDEVLLVEIKQP
jgi:hypothetical protein